MFPVEARALPPQGARRARRAVPRQRQGPAPRPRTANGRCRRAAAAPSRSWRRYSCTSKPNAKPPATSRAGFEPLGMPAESSLGLQALRPCQPSACSALSLQAQLALGPAQADWALAAACGRTAPGGARFPASGSRRPSDRAHDPRTLVPPSLAPSLSRVDPVEEIRLSRPSSIDRAEHAVVALATPERLVVFRWESRSRS